MGRHLSYEEQILLHFFLPEDRDAWGPSVPCPAFAYDDLSDQKALPFPGNTCLLEYHLPAECFPAPAPTIQNSARHSHCPLPLHCGFFPPHLNSCSTETRLGHLRAQPRFWPPRTNSGYLRSTRIDGLSKFQVDEGTIQACKIRGELGPAVPA